MNRFPIHRPDGGPTPARNRSVSARVSRTGGSINSADTPGNPKVTGYGQRTSAALEAEPRDLLLGPSGSIKGGPYVR